MSSDIEQIMLSCGTKMETQIRLAMWAIDLNIIGTCDCEICVLVDKKQLIDMTYMTTRIQLKTNQY